ncbi:hypothetical protein FRC11_007395 [Ceratobasidium sp. 423]|nr:hypothetical protein FRC11_007395 [Ceratobasidium sp. 423]
MAARMPVAYPSLGTSQINFSLPLRLAHKRSASSLSAHSSTGNLLEVSRLTRYRAASAPVSPADISSSTLIHSFGSDPTRSPTFLTQDNSFTQRPRADSYSSINRRPPPRLQLHDQPRLRKDSTSTTASSLEASLAELEELIEELSTPLQFDEGFFGTGNETKPATKAERAIRIAPNSANYFARRAQKNINNGKPGVVARESGLINLSSWMSFTNTPLGQQRRLDRTAFLNGAKKQQLKTSKSSADTEQPETQPSPPRRAASTHTIPVSYSYGAPELSRSSSGSPPKASSSTGIRPSSPTRSATTSQRDPTEEPSSEPGNVRYARLKQRNQSLGPTASTSSVTSTPGGVVLRDTSVNVANAFTQAAFSKFGGTMPKPKSTPSWSKDSTSATNLQQSLSSVDRTSDYEDAEALYQRAKAGLSAPEPDTSKSSASKKKPRKSRDNALYRPSESEEDESDGFDSDEGKRKKKHKVVKGMSLPIIGPSKTIRSRKPRRQSSKPSTSILGEGDLHSVSNLVQIDEEPSILPPSRGRTQSRSRSRSHTPRAPSASGHTTDSVAEELELEDALVDDDSNAYTDPEVAQQSREMAGTQQATRASSQSSFSYSPKRANNKGFGVGAALGTFVRSVMRALVSLKKLNYDVKVALSILVVLSALYMGIFRSSGPAKVAPPAHYEHTPMPKFDLPPSSLDELIERLAVLERAQRSTDTAIGDMSSRVGNVEGYVGNVDTRVGQVDTRMVTMEARVGTVETKIVRVDERVTKADDRLDRFDTRVEQVGNRAEEINLQIGKVDKFARDVDTRINQVDTRIGQVDTRVVQMDGWVVQAETKFDQLGGRVDHVERAGAKVGKPEGKTSYSDAQIRAMEARTRDIELKAKEIEGHVKRFESRAKEFDSKATAIDSKTKDIDSKTKELDAKSREHDAKSRDFESKLREIEAKFKDAAGSSWWRGTRGGSQQDQLAIGSEAMDQIVQRAVLATTKDTVMRADFALYTGGGRVIPEYTSPTFSMESTSGWRRMLGIGTVHGRSPAVALVPDINVGNCWPFAGSQGQIAVLLSRSVKVDAVTIDHASKEVAYDLRAAPRKFAVWGLVEGADNLEKLAKYQQELETQTIDGPVNEVQSEEAPPFKPARILLAEFEYDINAKSHIQTFEVSERVKQSGIDVGVVVFQIRSSWGDPNYTCLYRVRVHGEAVGPNVSSA